MKKNSPPDEFEKKDIMPQVNKYHQIFYLSSDFCHLIADSIEYIGDFPDLNCILVSDLLETSNLSQVNSTASN